jgi:hypothetical protein
MREELARDGSLSQFVMQIREQKCVEKILEKANIADVEPEKMKKPAKKAAAKKPAKAKKDAEETAEADGQAERKKTAAKRTKKKEE